MDLVQIIPHSPSVVLSGVLKGVYAAGTDYAPGEVVTYNGGTYIMHTDAAAGTLPTDTTKWQAINSPQAYVESINALSLVNTTTNNTISVDQNGDVGSAVATDGAIHIENTGNVGIGLGVYSNCDASSSAPLVKIHADNAAFDQHGLHVVYDGLASGIYSESTSTTRGDGNGAIAAVCSAAATSNNSSLGNALTVRMTNASATGRMAIFRNAGTGTALEITQDGAGFAMIIKNSGNKEHIIFQGDPTVASPTDGGMWFDGTNLKFRINTTTYNINMTAE